MLVHINASKKQKFFSIYINVSQTFRMSFLDKELVYKKSFCKQKFDNFHFFFQFIINVLCQFENLFRWFFQRLYQSSHQRHSRFLFECFKNEYEREKITILLNAKTFSKILHVIENNVKIDFNCFSSFVKSSLFIFIDFSWVFYVEV